MQDYPEPFDRDENAFVEGDEGRLDIDDIFAKEIEQVLGEFRRDAPDEIEFDEKDEALPSLFEPGYFFRDVPAGILLFAPDGEIAGGYLSCDLFLGPDHRGKGLGMEIVIERCLRDGENPVLNLDESAYSRAGHACHIAAWHHVRNNPRETRTRIRRWQGQSS